MNQEFQNTANSSESCSLLDQLANLKKELKSQEELTRQASEDLQTATTT